MYPPIRVEKLHPDGSPRAVWEAYRIEDRDGAIRVWKPGEQFVAAVWEETSLEMYIDIVRDVIVTPTQFAYVDLHVDVMHRNGRTWSKDEELAQQLEPPERKRVLATRDALLNAIRAGEAPFQFGDPRWDVPKAARALPPGAELALR